MKEFEVEITERKKRRHDKQRTPRILPILGGALGVLFCYRSIWHKCAACIQRMQYTKGLGLSQQAFCNAKMAFVYTNALLATSFSSSCLEDRKYRLPHRIVPIPSDHVKPIK